jgi:hypothetical protein
MHTKFCSENFKWRGHLGDVGIHVVGQDREWPDLRNAGFLFIGEHNIVVPGVVLVRAHTHTHTHTHTQILRVYLWTSV